jgi:hypothetical protein
VVQAETAKREELVGQLVGAQAARGEAESSFAELQAQGPQREAAQRLVSDGAEIETIARAAESRAREQAWKEIQSAQRAARRRSQAQNRRRRRGQGRPN